MKESLNTLPIRLLLIAFYLTSFFGIISSYGCSSSESGSPPASDTSAPSVPPNFSVSNVTGTTADLAWQASTDNVGVEGYQVYRDGVLISGNAQSPLTDTGLMPGIEYCYAVSAFDLAGNESGRTVDFCVIPVHQPPVAVLDAPTNALPNDLLTFDASSSSASDGDIVSYEFDFGDGSSIVNQSTPIAEHTFTDIGTFDTKLTVTDSFADESTTMATVVVGLLIDRPPTSVSQSQFHAVNSDATRAPDGSIYVVWQELGNAMISHSSNDGTSFRSPNWVIDPAGPWGGTTPTQLNVVATATAVHVTWTVFGLTFGGAEIFHSRSDDGGLSFTDPVMVSTFDNLNSYRSTLAAADDGTVLIAWIDSNLGTGAQNIHYARSMDDGASFPIPSMIPGSANWLSPDLEGTGTPAYLVITASVPEPSKNVFIQSWDGALTFSQPVVLDNIPQKSWTPQLTTDSQGTLYVAWEEGSVFDRKIMLARSTDGGISFSSPIQLSAQGTDNTCAATAAGDNGRVYVTWTEQVGPQLKLGDSYLSLSSDYGLTFSAPLRIVVGPPAEDYETCFQPLPGAGDQIGFVWRTEVIDNEEQIYYLKAQAASL